MTWGAPALAWAALPAAAVIIALYMLRMRRRDLVVPASFLWPERKQDIRANSLFQKLRPSWLLFLQLLALALLAAAAAQPLLRQKGLAGSVTVVVLDASASMGAEERGGATRFESGLNQVRQVVDAANPGDKVALLWAGPTPRVVFSLGTDRPRQRAAMEGLRHSDAPSDVGEALRLAAALSTGSPGARILLLSDGVFPEVQDFSPGEAEVAFQVIGQEENNLAVEALSVSETEAGPLAFASIRAFGKEPLSGEASLFADGRLVDSASLALQPGDNWTKTWPSPAGAEVLELRLSADDALQADNYAAASGNPGAQVRVLLVGGENPFLDRALALEPRMVVDKAAALPSSQRLGGPGEGVYDVVIFDGAPPEPVKARGQVVFGPESPAAESAGTMSKPVWLSSAAHPVMEAVELDGVYVDSAANLRLKAGAKAISETAQGPWIAALDGPKRTVHVGFSPLDSDFPLSIGFPIFLSNAVQWAADSAGEGALVVETGQAFSLAAGAAAEIEGPDGWRREASDRTGRALAPPLERAGPHTARWQGGEQRIFASLRDRRESSIASVADVRLGGQAVAGATSVDRLTDLWRPVILLGLLILAGEWWLFARRS